MISLFFKKLGFNYLNKVNILLYEVWMLYWGNVDTRFSRNSEAFDLEKIFNNCFLYTSISYN